MLTLCHNYFGISAGSKNSKDGVQQSSRGKYAFGVFLLVLVVVLWVVSAELTKDAFENLCKIDLSGKNHPMAFEDHPSETLVYILCHSTLNPVKYIYIEKRLDRPFLVTYVRSSLLFVYLIVLCFTPPSRDPCRPADYTQLLEPTADTDDDNCFTDSGNSLGDSTFVPVRAGETTDSDDAAPRAVRFNKVAEVRVMSAAQAGEALLARLSWAASVRASEHAQRTAAAAATRRHLRMALVFCAPWFISNYLYRLSLLHTSTSSATIYASSCGAIALSMAAMFTHAPHDRFDASKTVAVLLTATGLVFLAVTESPQSSWMGVLSALGSGVCYALHLILFRRELRKGDGINAPLLVGIVGCLCGCLAWVLGGVLAVTGSERGGVPPPGLFSWLLLDGALGPLLLESLWLWGRSLTTPQTATAVLALCLPLAACADAARGGGWTRGVASVAAAAGWMASAAPPTGTVRWISDRFRKAVTFSGVRNIPDLDEQSEALMSTEEPT